MDYRNITTELGKTNGKAKLHIGDIVIPVCVGGMSVENPPHFSKEKPEVMLDHVLILDEPTLVKKEEPKKEEPDNTFRIEKVTVNGPATIVFWKDGTKTVVKCQNGDKFDLEKGMAMAFAKKARGNSSKYYDVFKDIVEQHRDMTRVENFVRKYCRFYETFNGRPLTEDECDSLRRFAKAVYEV